MLPAAFPWMVAPPRIYSRYRAPIFRVTGGEIEVASMRWGIRRHIAGGETKLVDNSRRNNLSRLWTKQLETQRCLIPAAAFFEAGLGPVDAKGKVRFGVKERPNIFIAVLWDIDLDDEVAFSMVTTEPNEAVQLYYDRMPVILTDQQADEWMVTSHFRKIASTN